MRWPIGLIVFYLVTLSLERHLAEECKFSNHFAVEFEGNETESKELASRYGFKFLVKVFEGDTLYDFIQPEIPRCSSQKNDTAVALLLSNPKVKWVEQQTYRDHIIRHVIHDKQKEFSEPDWRPLTNDDYLRVNVVKKDTLPSWSARVTFNDPYFKDQWYLHNEGQTGSPPGNDLNVLPAWDAGFTGRGVILSVLDDGLQHTNPDIHGNFEPSVSFDLVDFETKRHDPMPDGNPENSHGTYCAGIIAAVANNTVCGVGVAYNAKVGGIRILDGPVTDLQEALALSLALDKVDIYSASWGPQDDGKHISGPATLALRAFRKGIEKGRNGKGAIYVWAVGNGGINQDNCNMDGYVSSIYTLSVSALADSGLSTYYTEPCASTLASTFVGGNHENPSKHEADIMKEIKKIKIVVPGLDGECIESFQGTSAAAPMAAGVIALVLEANPELTWRDVQHVVVEGARIPSTAEDGWQINGAGYHFHLLYGFGVMDAAFMVSLAQKWIMVGPMNVKIVEPIHSIYPLYPRKNTKIILPVEQSTYRDDSTSRVNYLEYVILNLNIEHHCRGNLEIFLISPSGTESQLLTLRPNDVTDEGITNWDFLSVHFWGESPTGKWIVRIFDHTNSSHPRRKTGSLEIISLTLIGTAVKWKTSHVFDPDRLGEGFYPNSTYLRILAQLEKRTPVIKEHHAKHKRRRAKKDFVRHEEVDDNFEIQPDLAKVLSIPSDVKDERSFYSFPVRTKRLPRIPEWEIRPEVKDGEGEDNSRSSAPTGHRLKKLNELLGLIESYIENHNK